MKAFPASDSRCETGTCLTHAPDSHRFLFFFINSSPKDPIPQLLEMVADAFCTSMWSKNTYFLTSFLISSNCSSEHPGYTSGMPSVRFPSPPL